MSLNASIPKTNASVAAVNAGAQSGGSNTMKNAFMNAATVNSRNASANALPKMNAANTPAVTPNAASVTPQSAGKASKSGKTASKGGKTSKTVKRGGANAANSVMTPPLNTASVANAAKATNAIGSSSLAMPNVAPAVGGRKKSASSKRGGALVDDLKNLAVPFAILLAKQGVENMYAKKNKASAKGSPKSASKPSSSRRRSTLAGGACTTGCGMTGGSNTNAARVKDNFSKIAADIDAFLAKY